MAMRDPYPSHLWRIADFSSLRLVINIEFFRRGRERRDEKAGEAPFEVRQELTRGGARGGVVQFSCVGGLERASTQIVGRGKCARKSSEPVCRPLSTLRHPTFFPHRAPYVPAGRFSRREIGNLPGNATNTMTQEPFRAVPRICYGISERNV